MKIIMMETECSMSDLMDLIHSDPRTASTKLLYYTGDLQSKEKEVGKTSQEYHVSEFPSNEEYSASDCKYISSFTEMRKALFFALDKELEGKSCVVRALFYDNSGFLHSRVIYVTGGMK